MYIIFFFSSRRRHTRLVSDWSSDVCSSDLKQKTAYERSEEHTSELQSLTNLVCRLIRSEEHTSELQSLTNIVCRLLLGKRDHIDAGQMKVQLKNMMIEGLRNYSMNPKIDLVKVAKELGIDAGTVEEDIY